MRFWLLLLVAFIARPGYCLEITGMDITSSSLGDHVALRLSGKATANLFTVDNPLRVVVDFPAASWRGKALLPPTYRGTLIQKLRYGFHDTKTSRLVLDVAAPVTLRNVQATTVRKAGVYVIEFDLSGNVSKGKMLTQATKPIVAEKQPQKPVIVIDAGHGGQDPGTEGYSGAEEKQITLRYAKALAEALQDTGRYRVSLTRNDDRYLFLKERVVRARKAKADLFISLHADSAPSRSARGLSVYTISETASDKQSEALAAKENKADVIGGMDLTDTSEDVAGILIDLAQRETRAKSAQFADLAVRNLGQEVSLLSNTHRFAGFAVLKAPDIPSVLVEVGFLTNPREESLLKSAGHEAKVVRGLVKAIDSYFGKHKN